MESTRNPLQKGIDILPLGIVDEHTSVPALIDEHAASSNGMSPCAQRLHEVIECSGATDGDERNLGDGCGPTDQF